MSAAARKVADLPASAAKYQGKLMAVKRSDSSITVTDQKLRKKIASVKIGTKIAFKKGYLYYVKNNAVYEKAMARRGSMKASKAADTTTDDDTDFSD